MHADAPILLVEDDVVDVLTVKRAMRELKITNSLLVAGNGEEALEILKNPDTPIPALILLDINMPRMNGIEFLEHAKSDAQLRTIPVVMLTTSEADRDRVESFKLGVAGYMLKPVDYGRFVETIRTVHVYWTLSQMPRDTESV